ncbi:hypothetical protein RAMDARK_1314 [Rickettsia amblyommatis str. Darkwater]|uniref:Uncharacterized protein n=1 Tax=Rickettsia amblyommatis str. Ac/Pa TaxID=1359164 RepID=A0A0F3N4P0_RICAM|nr:hypothetical protein APHACPA_1735 [Rickettsia amblyommatis str. Ac/Pa]KJV90832.1 hypothetical protein RAMDARK_1314 [Rickettsia amblyommatis str. Darkwater]
MDIKTFKNWKMFYIYRYAGKASGLKIIKNDCIKRTAKGLATVDNK